MSLTASDIKYYNQNFLTCNMLYTCSCVHYCEFTSHCAHGINREFVLKVSFYTKSYADGCCCCAKRVIHGIIIL